jgi:hypothetical protein
MFIVMYIYKSRYNLKKTPFLENKNQIFKFAGYKYLTLSYDYLGYKMTGPTKVANTFETMLRLKRVDDNN